MMVPGLLERPSQRHKHAATATLSLTSVSIVGGFNLAVITQSYYSYHLAASHDHCCGFVCGG